MSMAGKNVADRQLPSCRCERVLEIVPAHHHDEPSSMTTQHDDAAADDEVLGSYPTLYARFVGLLTRAYAIANGPRDEKNHLIDPVPDSMVDEFIAAVELILAAPREAQVRLSRSVREMKKLNRVIWQIGLSFARVALKRHSTTPLRAGIVLVIIDDGGMDLRDTGGNLVLYQETLVYLKEDPNRMFRELLPLSFSEFFTEWTDSLKDKVLSYEQYSGRSLKFYYKDGVSTMEFGKRE